MSGVRLGSVGRAVLGHPRASTVWAIWLAMTLAGLWFIASYSFTMPLGDEWSWLAVLTGRQPLTLAWLWSQHNEHRMMVPRIVYLMLGAGSGGDFRAGALANLFLLSALAAAMVWVARRLRGRTELCDAFFPLLLLNWFQGGNLEWGFQLNFILSVFFAGLIVAVVAPCGPRLGPGRAMAIAALSLPLGLCGAFGLVYLPPLACWMFLAAAVRWRDATAEARRQSVFLAFLAAIILALVAIYWVGYHRPDHHPVPVSLLAAARTSLQVLAYTFGASGEEIWPVSGAMALAVVVLLTVQALRFSAIPALRIRALGLLGLLSAVVALALAIGWGRSSFGVEAGFVPRYVTLLAPLGCLAFLQTLALGGSLRGIPLPRLIFVLMAVLAVVNMRKGWNAAEELHNRMAALERDAQSGIPPHALIQRHQLLLHMLPADYLAEQFDVLHQARLGPYRDPPLVALDPSIAVVRMNDVPLLPRVAEIATLDVGQSVRQEFGINTAGALWRIDVRIERPRRGRAPRQLEWALCEVPPSSSASGERRGVVDLSCQRGMEYLSITFPPLPLRGTERFELSLEMPFDSPPKSVVEVPRFALASGGGEIGRGGASLQAFLFLNEPAQVRPVLAAGPSSFP